MTHVLYFGKTIAHLQTETIQSHSEIFNRVCFPENVFSNDPSKQSKGGEQQLSFVKVICQQNNTFLFDVKSEIWAFGASSEGQLGLRIPSLVFPVNLSQVMENKVRLVAASQSFVAAYTVKKKLYFWGKLDELNLGESGRQKKIEFNKNIDRHYQLSCVDMTAQISDEVLNIQAFNNRVYVLTQKQLTILPTHQTIQQQFLGLACSQNHALAWDVDGRVWSWGSFADGKLGYMVFDAPEQPYPKLMESLASRVIQCACGVNYSLALDVKGDIYSWGKGPFKIELLKATQPTRLIEKNKSFVKVIAGDEHFGALDMIGQFYVWGMNNLNCLGNLPEEVSKPTLFSLAGIRIIDAGMGPNSTVLIVPSDRLQKLPNLNLDLFTSQQKKCFIEEASLIRDFTERRNRQTLMSMLTPTPSHKLIGDNDKEYDKANELIHQMQHQMESPRVKNTFHSTTTHSHQLDMSNRTMRSPISFDKVQNRLKKLEINNPLYLPILPRFHMTQTFREDEMDLDSLIQTEDDELKYRYIQLVKDNNEDQILMQLLEDNNSKKQSLNRKTKKQTLKIKQLTEPKEVRFYDKFDMLDPHLLDNVRKELAEISKERWKQYLKKRKLRENKIKMLKSKFQMTKLEQLSREEEIESNRLQAVEGNVKKQYTILRKEEKLKTRLEGIQLQLQENSTEFKIKKTVEVKREIARFYAFLQLLQYLNSESLCQMFEEASVRGLQKKRMLLQANNKAKIIQKAVRRRNIIKAINSRLGEKPKKILLSFIFRIRMQIRIKKKRVHYRKLNLYYQKTQLFIKVKSALNAVRKSAINFQRFCRWYNKSIKIQLSYLNYKWDEFVRQEFKGMTMDKDKEEQKINQLQLLNEKQVQIMKKLSVPYKSNKQQLSELQLIQRCKFKIDVLKTNILKKVYLPSPPEDDPKDKEIKISLNNVLLPYTKFVDNITIPQQFKIRFDYQEIQLLNVLEKINFEEAKLKLDMLQTYQRIQRKNYIQQSRNYFQALLDFKMKNRIAIGTERMKIMQKLSSDELKLLKQKDELEYRIMMSKRDISMKKLRLVDSVSKDNVFEKIRQFQQDNYPFQLLTYRLVVAMSKLEQPRLQIDLTQKEWLRLLKNYHTDFKSRIQAVMSEARRAAAYKAKQVKRSTTIKSNQLSKKQIEQN